MKNDLYWMQLALDLAEQAKAQDEVPVGAVIVLDGQLIGQGHNQVIAKKDPTQHAEIVAIQAACRSLSTPRLGHATLYVTLEPCLMCSGAILQARVSRLVFGARDFRAGAAGSMLNVMSGFGAYAPIQVDEGPLQEACASCLTSFFQSLR